MDFCILARYEKSFILQKKINKEAMAKAKEVTDMHTRQIPTALSPPQFNTTHSSSLYHKQCAQSRLLSHVIFCTMEQVDQTRAASEEAATLAVLPGLQKKSFKQKPVLQYHLMEQKILSAITDYRAGKYPSLAEAGRSNGITERAQYFRLRARAAGRASKSNRFRNGNQRLTPEQERVLCRFVDGLEDDRTLNRKIAEKAYSLVCEGLNADAPQPRPFGKQWAARFLERYEGILAPKTKPVTSPTIGQSINEPAASNGQDTSTNQRTSGDTQILLDCQDFLDRSANDDIRAKGSGTSSDLSDRPDASIMVAVAATPDIGASAATAIPLDPHANDTKPKRSCFFSAIRNSLAEQKMTFTDRPI